tara:strand:- start:15 stop:170 length:156 start_codon:yes stop_codon:yes gene_type:complete
MRCKRGIAEGISGSLILAVVVLIIILGVVGFLLGWWEGAIQEIKNIFRFGR